MDRTASMDKRMVHSAGEWGTEAGNRKWRSKWEAAMDSRASSPDLAKVWLCLSLPVCTFAFLSAALTKPTSNPASQTDWRTAKHTDRQASRQAAIRPASPACNGIHKTTTRQLQDKYKTTHKTTHKTTQTPFTK